MGSDEKVKLEPWEGYKPLSDSITIYKETLLPALKEKDYKLAEEAINNICDLCPVNIPHSSIKIYAMGLKARFEVLKYNLNNKKYNMVPSAIAMIENRLPTVELGLGALIQKEINQL